jgi:hypothetical protein
MCAVLAACGGDGDAGANPTTSSAATDLTTSSAPATTEARLGEVDVYTCQSFVADAGEAYGWLTTLEQTGSISGDLSTPGYLEVYQLGGTTSVLIDQVESAELRVAMHDVEDEGLALRGEIDAQGSVSPALLRQALDQAADVCEEGGIVIDWYAG